MSLPHFLPREKVNPFHDRNRDAASSSAIDVLDGLGSPTTYCPNSNNNNNNNNTRNRTVCTARLTFCIYDLFYLGAMKDASTVRMEPTSLAVVVVPVFSILLYKNCKTKIKKERETEIVREGGVRHTQSSADHEAPTQKHTAFVDVICESSSSSSSSKSLSYHTQIPASGVCGEEEVGMDTDNYFLFDTELYNALRSLPTAASSNAVESLLWFVGCVVRQFSQVPVETEQQLTGHKSSFKGQLNILSFVKGTSQCETVAGPSFCSTGVLMLLQCEKQQEIILFPLLFISV
eukprot:gene7737-5426_t